MKKMEIILLVVLWLITLFLAWQVASAYTTKNKKNAWTQENEKKQKLLRFKRGNTPLTPEQQKELDQLNYRNFNTLKQMWKDEHL